MDRQQHWNGVYTTKGEADVSWFEPLPEISMRMIEAAGATTDTCVVDIGGGDSRLVDYLSARGLDCLAVLDVSGAALHRAQARVGAAAVALTWIEADVTSEWSLKPMDIWHDRAVFHFLTEPADRRKYLGHLHHTSRPAAPRSSRRLHRMVRRNAVACRSAATHPNCSRTSWAMG